MYTIDVNASMWLGIRQSFHAGLSTSVGAIIVIMSPRKAISNNYMAFVLSLAAGVMASATVLEFWLPLFTSDNLAQDSLDVLLYSAVGATVFILLNIEQGGRH